MFGIVSAATFFLWMLPLAGLPILFHLFLRVRKQIRPFSTLMFFLQADPRMSARKKIREWLTLVLRTLAIAFLLLALSRPVWLGSGGGGSVAQVLIIDNSGSMSGKAPDGSPKLTHALNAAAALIADMRESDSLAIVPLVDDPAAAVPDGFVTGKETLRATLGRIKDTQASGSPARTMNHAFSLLAAAATARREVHIFTDMQETEWGKPPEARYSPPAGTSITVHRIKSRPFETANVAIGELELPRKRLVADRHYMAAVTLSNPSKIDARVRLNSCDPAGSKTSQEIDVPARGTRTVSLPVETHAAGLAWLVANIENDGFPQDNTSCAAFVCQARRKVVFYGPENDFGLVPLAVSPSGDGTLSGLIPVFKRAGVPFAEAMKDEPAMIVLKLSALPAAGSDQALLKSFVEQGGNLLVLADAGTGISRERTPAWLQLRFGEAITDAKGLAATALNKHDPLWDDLRDASGEVALRQVRVHRLFPLQLSDGLVPLMALHDGTPILAERPIGKGTVFVSGIDLDTKSSTLPLKGGFLAMIHGMALSVRNQSGTIPAIVAGSRLPGLEGSEKPVRIRAVAGTVMDWQGQGRNAPAPARAGVYSVETQSGTSHVAVRSSEAEGREAFLDADTVPALADVRHRVDDYNNPESFVRRVRTMRTGVDLYLPLLLLALAAAVAEGLVINPPATKHIRKTGAPGAALRGREFGNSRPGLWQSIASRLPAFRFGRR